MNSPLNHYYKSVLIPQLPSLIISILLEHFQSVIEKVVYKVSEENANWTVAKRSAWIDSSVFGFSRAIQAFGLDRFKKNCSKMTGGFNYVLAHMFPHTAQYMNPSLSQMGYYDQVQTKWHISLFRLYHSITSTLVSLIKWKKNIFYFY